MTKTHTKIATVFGGTGFIGRQVVRELAARGLRVKVATRVPERAYFLRPCGAVGQVVPMTCDYTEDSIKAAITGADIVVNCIGILFEKGRRTFTRAHVDIPKVIAKACKKQGVSNFVHISALGIEQSSSKYAASKLAGEDTIRKAYGGAVILRPSVVFGTDDNFFNMFAKLSGVMPFLPLIGGGHTKFQPVYVGDVADAVMRALDNGDSSRGKTYELGGADVVTFKDMYEIIFKYTGRRKALVSVPFCIAKMEAFILNLMPTPLLTSDQVESLKTDTIVEDGALTLHDLGIMPTAMDMIVPHYLGMYRAGGKFGSKAA